MQPDILIRRVADERFSGVGVAANTRAMRGIGCHAVIADASPI